MLSRQFKVSALWGCAVALALAAGCESRTSNVTVSSTRPAGPATAPVPAVVQATTQPASRPAQSRLRINAQPVEFPRARLVLVHKSPTVVVRLFSDDPKEALDPNYSGNAYFFEVPLEISDANQIAGMQATFQAASAEHSETANGIFLDGTRKHLQPFNVIIRFDRAGADLLVSVTGQFMMFRTRDQDAPPEAVWVHGELAAPLETK
jgi:hypothetical protein